MAGCSPAIRAVAGTAVTSPNTSDSAEPCIYCGSAEPPTKREHVMSRALGTFEHNWTLGCVCDSCNQYFANNLELPLGRDSREALLRIDLGLRPACAASDLLNRRVRMTLQDPGRFDGIRLMLQPSEDGGEALPVPVPQVALRREGGEWRFLVERELVPENLAEFRAATAVEIRIYGVGADCQRLKERLTRLGIEFEEGHRLTNQPVTEQASLTVVHDIDVDETLVRAACKIVFNYAAKVLGPDIVRHARFDAARRFVRYGEAPIRLATVQRLSILVGPDAESARVHACGLGWDRGYLIGLVSLFNEITYGIRLCQAERYEFIEARHFFDPLTRTITEAPLGS